VEWGTSLKTANNVSHSVAPAGRARKRSWSVATRLTVWYAISAFSLIVVATGLLYWALIRNLDQADDRLLADKARVIGAMLLNRPDDEAAIRQEVEEAWKARQDTQVYVRVLDARGQITAETPGMRDVLPVQGFAAPGADAGKGRDVRTDDGRTFRVLAVQATRDNAKGAPFFVQVGTDRSHEFELLASYRRYSLGLLAAALVLCSVIGHQIARRGIQPLRDITETARRIRAANLSERLIAEGLPSELLALAETFNQMLERLEHSFTRISRFSADIAHELRTPLNNLLGGIEVALSRSRAAEDYRDTLVSSVEECNRLARLIDNLLFLARAEAPKAVITREALDLSAELATMCSFYEAAANEAGVRLTVATRSRAVAEMNRILFQRALNNVVTNALAHTPTGGSITLTALGDASTTIVEVVDTGCGIDATDLPHVFDRFYRVDQARRSGEGAHVGLGLSLVKSIVELHGGTVHISSELGRGTKVTLRFPRRVDHLESTMALRPAEAKDDEILISASS
jgi:two-component system, OmpR family, heavy metal sensor histidine kinase CusS